jgi:16S rRNA (guanine1516-N2)-methyltransferase
MTDDRKLLVTTGHVEKPEHLALAQEFVEELGAVLVPRKKKGVKTIQETYGGYALIVAGEQVKLYVGETEFFFHPGMANTRIKRLKHGDNDIVINRSGVRPGDTVLDCTMGLGSDAIVFAHAVGPEGRVTGVEASPVIASLVRRGLQEFTVDVKKVNEAMRRVEVVAADHLEYLRTLPDQSVDIVYFDPMFRRTVEDSLAMEPLRLLGDDRELSQEAVDEAKRVARRRIVMKERWHSKQFARLGFTIPQRSNGSVNYGIIEIGGTER